MNITAKKTKRWFWWHKWTSLICTVFLLMLCITGLPLIFHHELAELTDGKTVGSNVTNDAPKIRLDSLIFKAKSLYPDRIVRYVFWDEEEPNQVMMDVSPSVTAPPDSSKYIIFDEVTGELLKEPKLTEGFLYTMLELHTDMFMGIGGKLFLGLMGILFVIAIVSGVVLYGPIMKKYDFGMVRKDKSSRLKWLDMHNLLGIVALSWTMVVGVTGVINTLSDVVLGLWQQGQLAEMVAPYKGEQPLSGQLSSLDEAIITAQDAAPGMKISIIAFPGTIFSSQHHYAVFVKGTTAVTSRLLKPALIDAKNGQLTDIRSMPWYVNTLFISQPLHFGDYGGMPLKIIWTLFDIVTIIILISGIYLWLARIKAERAQINRLNDIELNN